MSRVGDDMIDKMGRTGRRTSSRGGAPAWEDDAAATSRTGVRRPLYSVPALTSSGPQRRPNGTYYQPRTVGGDLEDVALLRDAREHVGNYRNWNWPNGGASVASGGCWAGLGSVG